MTYKVISKFHDKDAGGNICEVGDTFKGELNEERLQTLSTSKNKYNKPFIEKIEVEEVEQEVDGVPKDFPVHTGGGYYELSNGNKVQGKDKATDAEQALKE